MDNKTDLAAVDNNEGRTLSTVDLRQARREQHLNLDLSIAMEQNKPSKESIVLPSGRAAVECYKKQVLSEGETELARVEGNADVENDKAQIDAFKNEVRSQDLEGYEPAITPAGAESPLTPNN